MSLSNSDFFNCGKAMLMNREVSPDEIRNVIKQLKPAFPSITATDEELFELFEQEFAITIVGDFVSLENNDGHQPWFNVSANCPMERDLEWHFWRHLKEYLLYAKERPQIVVDSVDTMSSQVLSRLEDPTREGDWDRRGVVMGSVQAGKTGNYTALACKAIDAGYKVIIILAGIHNSLRRQTQDRINEELIGYDLDRMQQELGKERKIGVRQKFANHRTINTLTSSGDKGDFNKTIATQVGSFPSKDGNPLVLIIKKNVSILKNLYQWLSQLPDIVEKNNEKSLPDIPLLLIDDECDYASVDTKRPKKNNESAVNDEYDPTKTNRFIRQILKLFNRSAYVGYTATPYANIFINRDNHSPKYGEDLFPRHFVISLPQPSNYIGPEHLFGLDADKTSNTEELSPYPLVRAALGYEDSIPDTHKNFDIISKLPSSLKEAIMSFLLSCAARRIRRKGTPHNSMLIHVTRYTEVQRQVKELVESYLRELVNRIRSEEHSDPLTDFKELWERDFCSVSTLMDNEHNIQYATAHPWSEIRTHLYETAKHIAVFLVNGIGGDLNAYRDAEAEVRAAKLRGNELPWEKQGASVIAIGGDKLSRGLTLDGLTVSYYLRSSKMYDTLMQMGRWFGYRDGYVDLCRIYTTPTLSDWYRHIALANVELRNDLEYMMAANATPEDFMMKVRSHPGRLAITAANKSRDAEEISLSFAGEFPKTIVFDPRHSQNNIQALEQLIRNTSRQKTNKHSAKRYHWEHISPEIVTTFLRSYKAEEVATKVIAPDAIAMYIEEQTQRDELTNWHVVIVSSSTAKHTITLEGLEIGCVQRTLRDDNCKSATKISIPTLTTPADEALDLDESEMEKAWNLSPNHKATTAPASKAIRAARSKKKALLLIYLPSSLGDEKGRPNYGGHGEELVGFAISFPESNTAKSINYLVSPTFEDGYDYEQL